MTPLDERDPVDVLAEEFADRLRRGEHPSVGDYARANPDHADQLRDLLPAVAQMEFLKRFRRASDVAEKELPDRFGDFRIVRELGRGGMGVVFEAVQESLGRPVALKVLASHAQLDPVRRERFIREAQAAAKLHHTNIVPVFGVGEQDGIPYYVMQIIRGEGLNTVAAHWRHETSKVIENAGSTVEFAKIDSHANDTKVNAPGALAPPGPRYGDWSFVAEIGMQAADALHYAHKQGVLHRDVKPANLILDPTGRVWVADFGLAKLVNTHGLTATGDILGTLQYLAPECLAGDSDPRSDVYGLGATLYELLTLQPPYPMESPARLVKQVTDANPPAPRELNRAIPRDLETIVLKAMAREPRRRYVGPRELARDLQAFLDDRPIEARRETWFERSWRWCRRNPATAILSATAVAALVLAGVVGWVGYVNTKSALDAEARRLKEAEDARADAIRAQNDAEQLSIKLETHLKLSLEAFEKVFDAAAGSRQNFGMGPWVRPFGGGTRVGGVGSPPGPGGFGGIMFFPGPPMGLGAGPVGGLPGPGGPVGEATDKAAILEAILTFYSDFAKQNATNQRLQFEAARAYRRVGEMQSWLGQDTKAAVSFSRARSMLEDLRSHDPANDAVRVELIETYLFAPPEVFGKDTEQLLLRALELSREPGSNTRPYLAGSVWFRLGVLRDHPGKKSEAEAAYREAIAGLAAPREGADQRLPPIITEQAFARERLAALLGDEKRWLEAHTVLESSVEESRHAIERFSKSARPPREFNGVLAMTLQRLADVLEQLNDPRAADEARQEAKALLERMGPGGFGGPKKDGPPKKKN